MNYKKPKKSSDKKRLFALACAFTAVACLPPTMDMTVSKENEAEQGQPAKTEQNVNGGSFSEKRLAWICMSLVAGLGIGVTLQNTSQKKKKREKRIAVFKQINKLNHK